MPELKRDKVAKKLLEQDKQENQSYQYNLTEDEKRKIVAQVCQEVEFEETSRSEFMSIRAESMRLYEGTRSPKSDPWDGCSNITTMLTAAHCKLMHARLLPAVWNPSLLYWQPAEKSDIDNVDSVKKFMKWAIRQDIDMQDIADDATLQAVVDGTIIFKVRWVPEWKWVAKRKVTGFGVFGTPREKLIYEYRKFERVAVDLIEIEDYLQSGPDEQRCDYILHSTYMTLPTLKKMEEDGALLAGSVGNDLDAKISERVSGGAREIKEEVEGFNEAVALKNSHPIRIVERYGKWPVHGQIVDSIFTIAYESRTFLSGKPLTAVNRIGRRPFVVGSLIRRTGRVMGQSIPELLRGLQKEIDAIHNQRIDAGTIAIAPFGIYRASSSLKPEVVRIGPGVLIPVDNVREDIQLVQFPANFNFSYQEERMIVEYIEKLTVMSSYSFGRESDVVRSRATATSTLALLGQSDQAFTLLGVRLQKVFSRLLSMILQYYQMYMPPGLAERVLGEDAQGKLGLLFAEGLTPATIAGNFDAYMELDVSGGNKAIEQQAAMLILQNAVGLLQLAQDPRGWEIGANFLKKIGEIDVERYLGPKPSQAAQQGGMSMDQIKQLQFALTGAEESSPGEGMMGQEMPKEEGMEMQAPSMGEMETVTGE